MTRKSGTAAHKKAIRQNDDPLLDLPVASLMLPPDKTAARDFGTQGSQGSSQLVLAVRPSLAQTETVLHYFTGGSDGEFPSGLTADDKGNFFGTTN